METRHLDADVAIIGGGPGGSAAAIGCARRGLSVVVLERDLFETERPGETMHPGVRPILEQLGLGQQIADLTCSEHKGIWVTWGGPRRFEAYGEDENGAWTGFQVWRQDFDRALLATAEGLGAIVRRPCSVLSIAHGPGSLQTLQTSAGTVSARFVIDASGRFRFLSRHLDIGYEAASPQLIARYGYVTGECPARDEAPAIEGDRDGWTWTAKIRPRLYQWTRIDFSSFPRDGWLPPEFNGLEPLARTRGADVTWMAAKRLAGRNWFMIGDAAASLDPTSSRGVLKAFLSGMMAAHLASAVLCGQMPAPDAAEIYHGWLLDWFHKDVEEMRRFYRLLAAA